METIYALMCPVSRELFYVGRTKRPLEDRLVGHINDPVGSSFKWDWIRGLVRNGKRPQIIALERVGEDCVSEREAFWINALLDSGSPITNVAGLARSSRSKAQMRRRKHTKECYQCRAKKPATKHYFHGAVSEDGLMGICIACYKERLQPSRESNDIERNTLAPIPSSLENCAIEVYNELYDAATGEYQAGGYPCYVDAEKRWKWTLDPWFIAKHMNRSHMFDFHVTIEHVEQAQAMLRRERA